MDGLLSRFKVQGVYVHMCVCVRMCLFARVCMSVYMLCVFLCVRV